MEVEKIRNLRKADPFKPFQLVMDDGRKLLVDHPYYIGIPGNGRFLVWSTLDGGFERVSPARVRQAVLARRSGGSNGTKHRRRRRPS